VTPIGANRFVKIPYEEKEEMSARAIRFTRCMLACVCLVSAAWADGFVFDPLPGTGSFQLVPNGSFENGLNGWSAIGAGGSFSASTQSAFLGSASARGQPTSDFFGAGFGIISDPIAVDAGKEYVLSGYFDTTFMSKGALYLDIAGDPDHTWSKPTGNFVPFVIGSALYHHEWVFCSYGLTVPSDVHQLQVRLVYDGGQMLDAMGHVVPGQVDDADFGFIDGVAVTRLGDFHQPSGWVDLGHSLAGTHGFPMLDGAGDRVANSSTTLSLSNALENTTASLVIGLSEANVPFKGGVLVPAPALIVSGLPTSSSGTLVLSAPWPPGIPSSTTIDFQFWMPDPAGPQGFAASNAVSATTP
jgi:hypothetical protein